MTRRVPQTEEKKQREYSDKKHDPSKSIKITGTEILLIDKSRKFYEKHECKANMIKADEFCSKGMKDTRRSIQNDAEQYRCACAEGGLSHI